MVSINPSIASGLANLRGKPFRNRFTAFVSAASGGTPGTFTGSVTFWQGNVGTGVKLGVATVSAGKRDAGDHHASCTGPGRLSGAGLPINAVYTSTAVNIASTTGTLPGYVVNPAATTVKLTSSFPYWAVNTPVTFSAGVTAATGGAPVGTVSYTVNGADGYSFTSSAATLSAGKATFAPFTFPATAEIYTVTLNFTPTNGNFSASSTTPESIPTALPGQQTQQNVLKASSLTLAATPNPTNVGQTVTFTATLNGSGIQETLAAGGTVSFYDNGNLIGTGQKASSASSLRPTRITFYDHRRR